MRTTFITEREEIEEIIRSCDICFAGFTEQDGSPYVIPMSFGYENGEIILHSGPEGRHIQLLERDARICVTFCSERELMYQHPNVACSYSMQSRSVVCRGTVSFVTEPDEKEMLLNHLMKNYTNRDFKYSKPALMNVKVWRVSITEMTAKAFGQNFRSTTTD